MELLKYFEYKHLPDHLQAISKEYHAMAYKLNKLLSNGPEKTVALRKLLESKDCAVRSVLR